MVAGIKAGSDQSGVFEVLDATRGIAALFVVYAHVIMYWPYEGSMTVAATALDIFFMLSGFVIAFVYEPRVAQGLKFWDFMRNRVVRLYPIYLIGILMGAAVMTPGLIAEDGVLRWLAALLPELVMAPSIPVETFNERLYLLNGPAWSLFFEMWVNLVYILILRWLTTPRLIMLVIGSAVLLWLASYHYGTNSIGHGWPTVLGGFPRVTFGFFAGVLVYRIAKRPSVASGARTCWALAPLLATVAAYMGPYALGLPMWGELLILTAMAPALVWWSQTMQLPKVLRAPLMKLGVMSYTIYVFHHPIIMALEQVDLRLGGAFAPHGQVMALVVIAIAFSLAYAAEEWLDKPMRRWLDACLKRLQGKPVRVNATR